MGARSKIEWTDATWNPIRGCSRVSEGCRHCYAERIAARFSKPGEAYSGLATEKRWLGKTILVDAHLLDPIRWQKPRRIFVNSISDLFHETVPDEWIDRIFAVMAIANRHIFQVLTKRPVRMREYLSDTTTQDRWCKIACALDLRHRTGAIIDPMAWRTLPNVWLGVSVENQATADQRIPQLLATPFAIRFVSCEPLLERIDIAQYLQCEFIRGDDIGRLENMRPCPESPMPRWMPLPKRLHWVIVGGESGPEARPMHPDWACSVRDQCFCAKVPFFFKQNGAWRPIDASPEEPVCSQCGCTEARACPGGCDWIESPDMLDRCSNCRGKPSRLFRFDDGTPMLRVGKTSAGRLLDGREWNQCPKASRHAH